MAAEAAADNISLAALRRRLDQFDDAPPTDPAAQAATLASIEQALLHGADELCGEGGERNERPDHDEASARESAGDLFRQAAEVRRWQRLAQRWSLRDADQRADRLLTQLLDRTVERWHQRNDALPPEETADAIFQRLLRTLRLQLAVGAYDATGRRAAQFTSVTEALRERFASARSDEPPTDATRDAWAKALTDQAARVLAEIDELAPRVAAAQLDVMAGALQWHLDNVETERGLRRSRLKRKLRRLRAERQERELQDRLESRFGERLVSLSERLILVLIVGVLTLMALEWTMTWSRQTIITFHIIDAIACGFFLAEVGVKLALVDRRWLWLRRHFLIDVIPSIPIALLTLTIGQSNPGNAVRVGRAGRFARLPRLVRYVRLLRPAMRLIRGFGLLARGIDRIAPRFAPLLNRNIILYPTRDELNAALAAQARREADAVQLRVDLRSRWRRTLEQATDATRETVANRRLEILEQMASIAELPDPERSELSTDNARELPARLLLRRLADTRPSDVEALLDEELVEQVSRMVRTLARRPMRWLPIIRQFVPRVHAYMSDADLVAATARQAAGRLKRYHDRWFAIADLYGTVTPSQFVDRVGTMMFNSAFRPAYRLAMFGGGLLIVQLGLMLTALPLLEPVETFLRRFIGPTILVLGSGAIIVLAIGWWLKRLARQATEFYERSAEAQYLSLTEVIRTRHLARDGRILYDRVLRDEWGDPNDDAEAHEQRIAAFQARLEQSLAQTAWSSGAPSAERATNPPMERLVLLCRDWLDGAMFTPSDTRTTSQLLGSPAIRQLLSRSQRIDRGEQKALNKLDLRRQTTLFGGPYLWFNFVSRACAHSVAMLLVEYNRYAIPLRALDRYSEQARDVYRRWLYREDEAARQQTQANETGEPDYVTTTFTALHFLDNDPQRDQKIAEHFGDAVLERLREDRRLMIRRIFGTYPMHHLPKEERVVNLYTFYQKWLAGGRALLLPLFVLGRIAALLRWTFQWVVRSVREIRDPAERLNVMDAAQADFRTAVRKINRVRLPVVRAALRLRMQLDPKYLGAPVPGEPVDPDRPIQVEADRGFLDLDVEQDHEIDEARRRARADMRRLQKLIDNGLLREAAQAVNQPAEAFEARDHHRALAMAYTADYAGVRSSLSLHTLCREVFSASQEAGFEPRPLHLRWRLKRRFNAYWQRFGDGDDERRRAAWAAVQHNHWGVADAIEAWHRRGDQAWQEGVATLGQLLQHAERLCEQLATLRAVQTLSVLDVLHYRQHVYQLGGYADEEHPAQALLHWATTCPPAGTEPEPTAATAPARA